MNQKYASDCAYYVFYLVVKFNLLVKCHHYCHYYASAVPHICHLQPGLQCQRPLEICFKIRQQLFIELCYNSAAKTQNLQFYSVRVISLIIKLVLNSKDLIINTFSFGHLFRFIRCLAIHKMDILLSPSLMVSFTESEWTGQKVPTVVMNEPQPGLEFPIYL